MSPGQPAAGSWQPDWAALEARADALIASDPLATQIASVSPVGGYVAIALRAPLTDVIQAAAKASQGKPMTGPLVIAVDTLEVPAGDTVIAAPAVDIKARSIAVDGGGQATLQLRSDQGAAIQVTTAEISGTLNVALQTATGQPVADPGSGPLALSSLRAPEVLTAAPGSAPSASVALQDIADSLHEPWAIVALEISGMIGGTLIDDGTYQAIDLAAAMLNWTVSGCSALTGQRAGYPHVDFANIASIQATSAGMLTYAQSLASNATYAPVLSTSLYQQQIQALLEVAGTYDAQITALQGQENIDKLLAAFAQTLGTTYEQAQAPLLNSLKLLATEAGSVQGQLTNAATQLQQVSTTLGPLQDALTKAISDQFQQQLVTAAVNTLGTLLNLYVAMGAVLLFESPDSVINEAMTVVQQLINLGQQRIDQAISDAADSATQPPTEVGDFQHSQQGAQYLAGTVAGFGIAAAQLWAVVAAASASTPVNLAPDMIKAVEQVPDLSGFSVGGLDPVTYWNDVVIQVTAAVHPHDDLPQAGAYLEAVQLAANYGRAVGDLQMKLLTLYTQGMTVFGQLQAAYEAQASWEAMQKSLTTTADKVAAAIGLLQRGYLNVKRSIVLAVRNYRASFLYQWLQPADIEVDVSMDLVTLREQATNSVTGLANVLAGTGTGTVQPRQDFQNVTYTVTGKDLFTEVNGKGVARFMIPEGYLSDQLNGNTALYLTAATFELVGGDQDSNTEVELQIATSGHYSNQLGINGYWFVSRPVSMTNSYYPGSPPKWVTQWQFADKNAYLAPTPYIDWTLTVDRGDWQHATGITITLTGILLQNPGNSTDTKAATTR